MLSVDSLSKTAIILLNGVTQMTRRVLNRFAELLAAKQRKERRTYTAEEIATATGTTTRTVYQWMHNRVTRYDEDKILMFTQFLGCNLSDLLVIEDEVEDSETSGNIVEALPA
jgi:transcriptional regulator with XRE-family HTH domain